MENNKTDILQNPLDGEDAIASLASYLELVECPDGLLGLQEIPEFTPSRLRRACVLLPRAKIQMIKKFAIINKQRKNTA